MDKVTQQNAAGAEESASASEELSSQAAALRDTVEELMRLAGGRADIEAKVSVAIDEKPDAPAPQPAPAAAESTAEPELELSDVAS